MLVLVLEKKTVIETSKPAKLLVFKGKSANANSVDCANLMNSQNTDEEYGPSPFTGMDQELYPSR